MVAKVSRVVSITQILLFVIGFTCYSIALFHFPMSDNPYGAGYNLLIYGGVYPILGFIGLSVVNAPLLIANVITSIKEKRFDKLTFSLGLAVIFLWIILLASDPIHHRLHPTGF